MRLTLNHNHEEEQSQIVRWSSQSRDEGPITASSTESVVFQLEQIVGLVECIPLGPQWLGRVEHP
jgi:hypothetical protein